MEHRPSSFWSHRRVFVTGATGLLGSWLVDDLVARGADVVCLVRDWVPTSALVTSGTLARTTVVSGDLLDYAVLLRALNEYELDTVFHLGAQAIVGAASRSPLSTFESNVRGTWNLLEACRMCAALVQRIVVASSDKAYGAHETQPYTEDMALRGGVPHDASKACADLVALSYAHTYRTPVAITRCGNLFGGGDLNYSRLIPGTIRSVLFDEAPVIRSTGTFKRDYFYIADAVAAHLTLAEYIASKGLGGEAFNIGNEQPLSALDVVNAVLRVTGSSLVPVVLDHTDSEIPSQFLDCSKARTILGWRPHFTFDDALRETVAWYRKHLTGAVTVAG